MYNRDKLVVWFKGRIFLRMPIVTSLREEFNSSSKGVKNFNMADSLSSSKIVHFPQTFPKHIMDPSKLAYQVVEFGLILSDLHPVF